MLNKSQFIREYDKERGKIPKITEPKTPFLYYDEKVQIILNI